MKKKRTCLEVLEKKKWLIEVKHHVLKSYRKEYNKRRERAQERKKKKGRRRKYNIMHDERRTHKFVLNSILGGDERK